MIGRLFGRRAKELDEEIQTHLRMAIEDRMARGESREEAERHVRREFGSVTRVKEAARMAWGGLWIDHLMQDLAFAGRQIRRHLGFTAIAFATIAVSIGLTTSVFTLVNGLLFSPMPRIEDPGTLVALMTDDGGGAGVSSYMDYLDFEEQAASFASLSAFKSRAVDLQTTEGTARLRGLMVSDNYFRTLGVEPATGRFFLPEEDDVPGAVAVAVLSHGLWQTRFGGAPDAVGQTININRRAFTIVGVAAEGFRGTNLMDVPDVYVPMAMQPHLMPSSGLLLDRRGWGGIDVMGRLAEGVAFSQAFAEVRVIGDRLVEAYPNTNTRRSYELHTFRDATMPAGVRSSIVGFGWILVTLVALVLLIACVNVANLLLTRGHARRREVAVRQSIGATKGRLLRQLLTETSVLAVLGGIGGLLLSYWATGLLASIPQPFQVEFTIDRNVLLFAFGATVLTGLAFGLAPALAAARREVIGGLRDAASRAGRRRRLPVSDTLVVAQVALSVTVLAAAGLFGKTLLNLRLLDPGFDSEGVLTAQLDPSLQGFEGEQVKNFHLGVLEASASLPGVTHAALSSRLPGPDADGTSITIENYVPAEGQRLGMQFSIVSHQFFSTMGIPVRRGRAFDERDRFGGEPSIVINEAAARFIADLTGADAIDARISVQGPDGPFLAVIGVVANVRSGPPRQDPVPHMYWGFEQVPAGAGFASMALLIRGTREAASYAGPVRQAAASIDRSVPLMNLRTLDDVMGEGVAQESLAATVLGVAALLALLMASLGLYGVLAHAVTRRTSEIGVRIALGAAKASVLRGVLARSLGLTAIGLVLGLALAVVSGQALTALLYGVTAADAGVLITVTAVLLAVGLLAGWIPARRATRIDPVRALRVE